MSTGAVDDMVMAGQGANVPNIMSILYNSKDLAKLKMISEVSPEMEFPMAILGIMAERFESPVLEQLQRELLSYMVSKDRKGRFEAVEIYLGSRRILEEE